MAGPDDRSHDPPEQEPAVGTLVTDDDALVEDAPAGEPAPTAPPRRGAIGRILPWVLVVLAVALAVVSTWRWQQLAGLERTRAEVAATASEVVATLTTWDASDGMADTRDALSAAGTERFAGDVDQLFGSTADLAALADLDVRSDGDVRDVYVQSLQGDVAEVLTVVVQEVTTAANRSPDVTVRYARTVLERRDGDWLVDEIELLVEAVDPSADEGGIVGGGTDEGGGP